LFGFICCSSYSQPLRAFPNGIPQYPRVDYADSAADYFDEDQVRLGLDRQGGTWAAERQGRDAKLVGSRGMAGALRQSEQWCPLLTCRSLGRPGSHLRPFCGAGRICYYSASNVGL